MADAANTTQLIKKTNNFLSYIRRTNDDYRELSELIAVLPASSQGNLYNHLQNKYYNVDVSTLNRIRNITRRLIPEQNWFLKSVPIEVCEVVPAFSVPVVSIEFNDCIQYTDRSWNKLISPKQIKCSIAKPAAKAMFKIIGESMDYNMAIAMRPKNENLILQLSFPNIKLDLLHKEKFVTEFKGRIKDKFLPAFNISLPRFVNFYGTSMYDGEQPLNGAVLYNYDAEVDDFEDWDTQEIISEIITSQRENTFDLGESCEYTAPPNDNSLVMDMLNPKCEQLSIILKYLDKEYFNEELIKSFNRSEEFKELIRSVTPADIDFDKIWNDKVAIPLFPPFFYYRKVMYDNGYGVHGRSNDFITEYNQFIESRVKAIVDKYDGKINNKAVAELASYVLVGKYYALKGDKKKECSWFSFNDVYTNCEQYGLYKWSIHPDLPCKAAEEMGDVIENAYDKIINAFKTYGLNKDVSKIITQIKNTRVSMGNAGTIKAACYFLTGNLQYRAISSMLDAHPYVVGCGNCILNLNIDTDKPLEVCYGYNNYFVTKSTHCRFNQKMYDSMKNGIDNSDNPHIVRFWNVLKDIIIEDCAREYIMIHHSTMIDGHLILPLLEMIAGGRNGKSVLCDNILITLADLVTKLGTDLLTGKPPAGNADPSFMRMRGKRGGIITETKSGDKFRSDRIKQITERIKEGRGLYSDGGQFSGNSTVTIASNFRSLIDDTTDGSRRRLCIYVPKSRFVEDPTEPNEKKVDPKLATITADNQDMADALFAILVYFRMLFKTKYNDNIETVISPVIRRETDEYWNTMDRIGRFISEHIIQAYGYKYNKRIKTEDEIKEYYSENELEVPGQVTLDEIANAYKKWYESTFSSKPDLEHDDIKGSILNSRVEKFRIDNTKEIVVGLRISNTKLDQEYFI